MRKGIHYTPEYRSRMKATYLLREVYKANKNKDINKVLGDVISSVTYGYTCDKRTNFYTKKLDEIVELYNLEKAGKYDEWEKLSGSYFDPDFE